MLGSVLLWQKRYFILTIYNTYVFCINMGCRGRSERFGGGRFSAMGWIFGTSPHGRQIR